MLFGLFTIFLNIMPDINNSLMDKIDNAIGFFRDMVGYTSLFVNDQVLWDVFFELLVTEPFLFDHTFEISVAH